MVLRNIGGKAEDEAIPLTGQIKFKKSVFDLINSQSNGAQVQSTDTGAKKTLFELSDRTSIVGAGSPAAASACGLKYGWISKNTCKNFSDKLESPVCIDKSARFS